MKRLLQKFKNSKISLIKEKENKNGLRNLLVRNGNF